MTELLSIIIVLAIGFCGIGYLAYFVIKSMPSIIRGLPAPTKGEAFMNRVGIQEDDMMEFTPKHIGEPLPKPFNDIPFAKSFIGHYCWTGTNYPIISIIENCQVPPYYGGYLIDDFPFNEFSIKIIGNTCTTPKYMKYNRHLVYMKSHSKDK